MSASGTVTVDGTSTRWQEVYCRLAEIVGPRPIALVSTVGAVGRRNLAPFSFFTVVSTNPRTSRSRRSSAGAPARKRTPCSTSGRRASSWWRW